MTFEQFIVCSLLGLTIYALGFWRGVEQGLELAGNQDGKSTPGSKK